MKARYISIPGQTDNKWIKLMLKGVTANRAAIGADLKIFFKENGTERMVYREVNSGGSFGSNPLMQQIGIGSASSVDKIEIRWPGDNSTQSFTNLGANQTYILTEGMNTPVKAESKKLDFMDKNRTAIGCAPLAHK